MSEHINVGHRGSWITQINAITYELHLTPLMGPTKIERLTRLDLQSLRHELNEMDLS